MARRSAFSAFVHSKLPANGVVVCTCLQCGQFVAASSSPASLLIAEDAHRCGAEGHMAASILQVAYYPTLLETRQVMQENDGYDVTSALGNDQAIALSSMKHFDVVVVGFSTDYGDRTFLVRWLKQHLPQTPVVALLSHQAEHFPDADSETMCENQQVWLAAVREYVKHPEGCSRGLLQPKPQAAASLDDGLGVFNGFATRIS